MNPVQKKISCVYQTGVIDEPSNKRQHQTFKVTATRELKTHAIDDGISSAKATEKIDGTCCLVEEFEGKPWLWARHDRKPSKGGERRFAQHKRAIQNCDKEQNGERNLEPFQWNPAKDFKEVPEHWIPALGLEIRDGVVLPDEIGHTPGWVPVQKHQRQHCWHQEVVDLITGTALVLRQIDDDTEDLIVESLPLSALLGQTCELIGTNINGNPYGLGSKKNPFHILIVHGALPLTCPDPSDYDNMRDWMTSEAKVNQVEGVVWHCGNGQLYKLHRHHLNLKWPDEEPYLCQRKVKVRLDHIEQHRTSSSLKELDGGETSTKSSTGDLFLKLSSFNGHCFNSLKVLCDALVTDASDHSLKVN